MFIHMEKHHNVSKDAFRIQRQLLLPAERLLQPVDGLTRGLQDALSVPHPNLPGSGLRTDGADGEQLTVTSPRHPRPPVVPRSSRLHLLCFRFTSSSSLRLKESVFVFLNHTLMFLCSDRDLDFPLCCLFPLRAVELSLLLPPANRDELSYKNTQYFRFIQNHYHPVCT